MHKLTKISPLIRKEMYNKYKEKMKITKGKKNDYLLFDAGNFLFFIYLVLVFPFFNIVFVFFQKN